MWRGKDDYPKSNYDNGIGSNLHNNNLWIWIFNNSNLEKMKGGCGVCETNCLTEKERIRNQLITELIGEVR